MTHGDPEVPLDPSTRSFLLNVFYTQFLFIITDHSKTRSKGGVSMTYRVDVMKDKELKLEETEGVDVMKDKELKPFTH